VGSLQFRIFQTVLDILDAILDVSLDFRSGCQLKKDLKTASLVPARKARDTTELGNGIIIALDLRRRDIIIWISASA
jgi:hypothetical protein